MSWVTRKALEAMSAEARAAALEDLRAEIDRRLSGLGEWDAYWRQADAIVKELKRAGHDLWSWDYDGERRRLWGWDYNKPPAKAGRLQIQFDFEGTCRTFWRDDDPTLGVVRDDGE